jgi:Putative MetA-pathway of phenol degradation
LHQRVKTPIAALVMTLVTVGPAAAQELEPRAYSPSPVGTTFVAISATRSAGGVFTDPAAPITDVDSRIGVLGLGIGHVFGIAGKQVLLLGAVPVTWGEASGAVGENRGSVSRRGLADPRVKVSLILAGSPAMALADFARAPRRTIVGTSLTIVPPVGQYDTAKLINLGSNRWAFKPELGVSHPAGRWTLDAYAGGWFFTENEAYFPGTSSRAQDPIFGLQGHVSYTLGRRAWLAVDATWYSGGRTRINDLDKSNLQRNTRLGATWAIPIGARQSVKVAYSAGATTRIGADFRTITAAWQMVMF